VSKLVDALHEVQTNPLPLAVDIETSGKRWWRDVAGVVSFAWGTDEDESYATRNVALAQAALQARMDAGLPVVLHGCQFDLHFLSRRGLRINWSTVHDTLLLARLKNNLGDNKLKSLGVEHLGIEHTEQDLLKQWLHENKSNNFLDVPDHILLPYARQDTRLTLQLYWTLRSSVDRKLYDRELKIREAMFDAEEWGIRIDPDLTQHMLEQALKEQEIIDARLKAYHPDPKFKISSDAQVRKWLYEDIGLTPVSFTPTGLPQVNEYNLASNPHPVTKLLIARNQREVGAKFFASYLEHRDALNLLHPNINTMQARTHRFSCTEPNLQQIPARGDRFHTREVFISDSGWFVGADFDKQELFIAACEAKETLLMKQLFDKMDPYVDMARAMLGRDNITPNERTAAKVAILSMLYGAGAATVARSFTVNTGHPYTVEKATVMRNNFKAAYPGLTSLMNRMQNEARKYGGVRNKWGRWLYVESGREYVATDYLVQSSGRDVLANAILNLREILPEVGGRILLPIHDEVIAWVPEEPSPAFLKKYADAMVCEVWELPLTATPKYAKTLGGLK
jgi:DNA polymerase-1